MSTPATANFPSLYGRKYEIKVDLQDGSTVTVASDKYEHSLKVTFDVFQVGYQNAFWYADISIWNLDADKNSQLITQGDTVTVSAGYLNGNYGQIFKAKVFQPMFSRPNVVDFITTLHCIIGPDAITNNFVNIALSAYSTQYDYILKMAQSCYTPIPVKDLSDDLKNVTLPRGRVLSGNPGEILSKVAEGNGMQWFISEDGLNMGKPDDKIDGSVITYTPTTGLRGTPMQTQDGVVFTVDLDSRIRVQRPTLQVALDQVVIQQAKAMIGQLQTILDKNGTYLVGAVRHYGDTWGNDWCTEITGFNSVSGKMAAMGGVVMGDFN
jgi:hypothetical protein